MATCPDAVTLQRLLDGDLPDAAQTELSQHIETCATCRVALDQIATGGQTFSELARDLKNDPTSPEPGLRDVLAKADALPGETQAEEIADDADGMEYLSPARVDGALGALDHYDVLEVIGKGGFGTVFKARDTKLQRIVAIKVLAPELAANAAARKRFSREAKATAAVMHENLVTIHAVEADHRPPYLVMQLIDGVTLQQKLDKAGCLSVKEILRIGMQMAEGLAAAHKQGLVHRDIKPANVLLENGVERVKVTDFGLARAVDDASVTQSGTVAGTPMYMSPEQANGEPLDHRSDLFSLGTVLYVMCTGRPPFRASGTMAVLKRVIDDTPRPIREINSEIPEWLCDVINKLHAKKPADRFQTAKEVAELLGTHLGDVQAGRAIGRAGSVSDRSAPTATADLNTVRKDDVSRTSAAPKSRPRKWVLAGVGLVAAALLVGLGWIFNPFRERHSTVVLRAEDVLPQLVGTWAIDVETTLPKPDTAKGVARFDWVAGEKFLRSYATYDQGAETLTVHRYVGDGKNFKRWFLSSRLAFHAIQSGLDGEWDMKTQTMTYRGTLPLFHKVTHVERWVGVNHVEINTEIKDHLGAVILRQTKKMQRTADAAVGPKAPADPKRPPEFALLDRQVGSWTTTVDVTLAELGGEKVQSRTTNETVPILAHRFVESNETLEQGSKEYWLFGYDELRRIYRLWRFSGDGEATESDCAWDPKEKTLTWKSLDGRYNGTWTFTNDNERLASMSAKDAQGRRLFEVTGISRRDGAVAANEGWVQLFNGKDLTGWKNANWTPEKWKIEAGNLIASGQASLVSNSVYTDFHCRIEAKIEQDTWGSLAIRHHAKADPIGTPITTVPKRTGSIWRGGPKTQLLFDPHKSVTVDPDTWITVEIIAQRNKVTILVDGIETCAQTVEPIAAQGNVTINLAGPGKMTVRKIEIKELPPARSPAFLTVWNKSATDTEFIRLRRADKKPGEPYPAFYGDANLKPTETHGQTLDPGKYEIWTAADGKTWKLAKSIDLAAEEKAWFTISKGELKPWDSPPLAVAPVGKAKAKVFPIADFREIHGADRAAFDKWAAQQKADGYVPQTLAAWNAKTGEARFAAIAVKQPNVEDWQIVHAVKADDLKSKFDELYDRSFHPQARAAYLVGQEVGFADLWLKGANPGNFSMWRGYRAQLDARLQEFRDKNTLRPVSIAAVTPPASAPWFGHVYHASDGLAWDVEVQVTKAKLVAQLKSNYAKGYWLVGLNVYDVGGQPRFVALFVENPARTYWWVHLDLSTPEYEKELAQKRKEGIRPLHVCAHDVKGDTRYSVIWVRLPVAPAAPPLAVAPFDAKKAKEHQDAWAKHLGVEPEITNSIGMKLRLIPPGKNALGASGAAESADACFLATTEVTIGQFRNFVNDEKFKTTGETNKLGGMRVQSGKKTERMPEYIWSHPDFARGDDHPVTLVTWHDAMAFCNWLSKKEGRMYRLPTGAEWRWAARAGSGTRFYFGDNASNIDVHAWHIGNSEVHSHPVAAKERNPWGLFDMYGNAWELSYDWKRAGKPGEPVSAKSGPGANDRILFLGGGFSAPPDNALETSNGPPFIGYSHLGFRVALVGDLKAMTPPLAKALQEERKALNGTWELKSRMLSGKNEPAPEPDRPRIVIMDGRYVHQFRGKDTGTGAIVFDPAQKPQAVDLTHDTGTLKGKTIRGIYEHSGDELRLCLPRAGDPRPARFESTESIGNTIETWVRVKDKS